MILEQAIVDRIQAKCYERISIPYRAWRLSKEYEKFNGMVLGYFSATSWQERIKFIDEGKFPYPYTERARAYLDLIFTEQEPRRKRVAWNSRTKKFLKLNPPYYYAGPYAGPLAYVDIVACYASLYGPLTLDVRFSDSPLKLRMGRVHFLEFGQLVQDKLVRNALGGGIIRSQNMLVYSDKRGLHRRSNYNKFLAPELWGLLMLSLHAIAFECINLFDCLYWNFDGAIVPLEQAEHMREYLADKWRLDTTLSGYSDAATLRGFGSYSIGAKNSKRRNRTHTPLYSIAPYDEHLANKLKQWRAWAMGAVPALV